MPDARGVRLRETLGDLVGDVGEPSRREPAGGQQVAQGRAVHPFHGDERHAGLIANVVDGQDIGMVQCGRGLGFLLEATHAIGIVGETGWEDLDRDLTLEAGIQRAVHLTHAACPERTEDLIRAEQRRTLGRLQAHQTVLDRPRTGVYSRLIGSNLLVAHL